MKKISVYPNFSNKGGAQNVALQLAHNLNEDFPIILTNIDKIDSDYKSQATYLPFSFKIVRKLMGTNVLFLSHHRKTTSILLLYSYLIKSPLHIIHVAHNTFTNLRYFTFFPKRIIAVSNGVKENLIHYFHQPEQRIQVIFNGLKDCGSERCLRLDAHDIRILIPGRICSVKQQVEIVKYTRGKLLSHVHIYFAGVGEDEIELRNVIGNSEQYHYLGYINLAENINQYDYVCLFSQKEGLPLSLIESCMFGKPMITNDLLSVMDVNRDGETGFVFKDFDSLVAGLNALPFVGTPEYIRLSNNARKRYEEYFTEDKMIEQYRKVINENLMIYK